MLIGIGILIGILFVAVVYLDIRHNRHVNKVTLAFGKVALDVADLKDNNDKLLEITTNQMNATRALANVVLQEIFARNLKDGKFKPVKRTRRKK